MTASVSKRWYVGWLLTFLGFPLGGLPAIALGGVDDVASAILGGAAAGLVIGAAQGLALSRLALVRVNARRPPRQLVLRWSLLSGLGLSLGLAAGSAAVGYDTSGADLLVQGLLSGLGIGTAQLWAGRPWLGTPTVLGWAVAVTLLWPLAWTVTRLAGVSVGDQFAVFGASGALTFTALSGLVLVWLLPRPHATPSPGFAG